LELKRKKENGGMRKKEKRDTEELSSRGRNKKEAVGAEKEE